MKYRAFGSTGWEVSEIGFGAWAIGADWGHVSEVDALQALHKSIDLGVNLIDTADVYGDGRSERLIAQVLKGDNDVSYPAQKPHKKLAPHELNSTKYRSSKDL